MFMQLEDSETLSSCGSVKSVSIFSGSSGSKSKNRKRLYSEVTNRTVSIEIINFMQKFMQVTNKLPEPFPIPLFRKVTMDALAQKRYTTDDRKYMIRVLSTMILTHIEKSTMSDCANVSKALTLKYPFLGDYVSDTTYTLV